MFYWEAFFLDAAIRVWLVEGCSDGWPSGAFRILGLDQPDPQQIAHAVVVVSFGNKCLLFQNDKGIVLLRFFQHSRNISVFSRSVPSHNSVFGLQRKFFWPHGSIFTLTLSAVRFYMGRYVFLNHIQTHRWTWIKVINRKERFPEFKCKESAYFQQCKTRKRILKFCITVVILGYWDT